MCSIDLVWESYQATIDSMKVTRRAIDKGPARLVAGTNISEWPASDAAEKLKAVQDDVDDLFILALWAVFERELRDFVETEGARALASSSAPFYQNLSLLVCREVEYWNNDDLLDLFKTPANAPLIGNAKQVRQYRDWVAHRNPKRSRVANITPEIAYSTLSAIINTIENFGPAPQNPSMTSGIPIP